MFSITMVYCAISFGLGVFLKKGSIKESISSTIAFGCVLFCLSIFWIYLETQFNLYFPAE